MIPDRSTDETDAMTENADAFNQICCYTLVHTDRSFIHQHVVDAFAAQDASEADKPMKLAFSLVGLYLHAVRGFTGREVQLAHMKLASMSKQWPTFPLPDNRGEIDAKKVLAAPLSDRDAMIHQWCESVWKAFSASALEVEKLLSDHGITDAYSFQRHRSENEIRRGS